MTGASSKSKTGKQRQSSRPEEHEDCRIWNSHDDISKKKEQQQQQQEE